MSDWKRTRGRPCYVVHECWHHRYALVEPGQEQRFVLIQLFCPPIASCNCIWSPSPLCISGSLAIEQSCFPPARHCLQGLIPYTGAVKKIAACLVIPDILTALGVLNITGLHREIWIQLLWLKDTLKQPPNSPQGFGSSCRNHRSGLADTSAGVCSARALSSFGCAVSVCVRFSLF